MRYLIIAAILIFAVPSYASQVCGASTSLEEFQRIVTLDVPDFKMYRVASGANMVEIISHLPPLPPEIDEGNMNKVAAFTSNHLMKGFIVIVDKQNCLVGRLIVDLGSIRLLFGEPA